ncbi:MAG: nucleoside phosphorylase [Candidatus Riflebacteria bacterium]|nr:nucleoside phosphorylase [Candidatus Riflebacteria bacterium]
MKKVQPHLKVAKGDISSMVLTCGDPARAAAIAELCDESKEIAYNREYRTFNSKYKGKSISITSHGVGSAGAAICFEELIAAGATTIIRVGTCGSLSDGIGQGDLIIANAAAREDGVSALLVPQGFPAIADSQIASALEASCRELSVKHHRGMILTSDLFYPGVVQPSLAIYSKAGVLGVEMECSVLFVIASLRKISAGAALTVDGNPLKWSEGDYDPHGTAVTEGKKKMLTVGLEAIAKLCR